MWVAKANNTRASTAVLIASRMAASGTEAILVGGMGSPPGPDDTMAREEGVVIPAAVDPEESMIRKDFEGEEKTAKCPLAARCTQSKKIFYQKKCI